MAGDKIPIGSRILSLVNDYDALCHGALTGERFSPKQAQDYIAHGSGTHYDSKVVKAFLSQFQKPAEAKLPETEMHVKSEDLVSGMVLSRDLVTKNGVLYLSKGYILDEALIRKIRYFERSMGEDQQVYVMVGKGKWKAVAPHRQAVG